MSNENMPEIGENVVCKVKKILPYGVFVELVEYGLEGFVHISQVESGWIKNIRKVIKEGEIRVGKITSINKDRNQIDVSFTKVSKLAEKAGISEWKKRKKINMMMEVIAKSKKKPVEEAWEKVAEPLIEEYGDFDSALKSIAINKEKAISKIDKNWKKSAYNVLSKSAQLNEKTIKRIYEIKLFQPDAVDIIKSLFKNLPQNAEAYYLGGGQYSIEIKSLDLKKADETLTSFESHLEKEISRLKGVFKKKK